MKKTNIKGLSILSLLVASTLVLPSILNSMQEEDLKMIGIKGDKREIDSLNIIHIGSKYGTRYSPEEPSYYNRIKTSKVNLIKSDGIESMNLKFDKKNNRFYIVDENKNIIDTKEQSISTDDFPLENVFISGDNEGDYKRNDETLSDNLSINILKNSPLKMDIKNNIKIPKNSESYKIVKNTKTDNFNVLSYNTIGNKMYLLTEIDNLERINNLYLENKSAKLPKYNSIILLIEYDINTKKYSEKIVMNNTLDTKELDKDDTYIGNSYLSELMGDHYSIFYTMNKKNYYSKINLKDGKILTSEFKSDDKGTNDLYSYIKHYNTPEFKEYNNLNKNLELVFRNDNNSLVYYNILIDGLKPKINFTDLNIIAQSNGAYIRDGKLNILKDFTPYNVIEDESLKKINGKTGPIFSTDTYNLSIQKVNNKLIIINTVALFYSNPDNGIDSTTRNSVNRNILYIYDLNKKHTTYKGLIIPSNHINTYMFKK